MANIAKGKKKMQKIPERLLPEIRYALEKDSGFDFKWNGNNLRFGICPNCGERECFINLDQPYHVSCGRLNNCGWNATIRELYPDIFDNLSRRYPATEENPNATADAYLVENRGFSIESIKGMYTQENVKNARTGEFYPSIKVIINQTCYWQRIIDAEDVRKNGAKTKIVGDYKDFGWIPPEMTFGSDDEVWITEGIFKSISLLHVGKKSMTSLSASNLPRRVIGDHAGKNIT